MPIFEYTCQACKKDCELLVNSSTQAQCPHCSSTQLEKKFSVFAANGKVGGEHVHTGPGCACGNPQGPCNN